MKKKTDAEIRAMIEAIAGADNVQALPAIRNAEDIQLLIRKINETRPTISGSISAVKEAATRSPDEMPETEGEVDWDKFRFEMSCSSEEPYERWWGIEILGHDVGEVRMGWISSGNAPLLFMHDMERQLGILENFKLASRRGKTGVRFGRGELAREKMQDVVDGILVNVSIGYRIHAMQLIEEIDGVGKYRVTDWEPYEVSLVTVPADQTVGVNRGAEKTATNIKKTEDSMDWKKMARELGMNEDSTPEAILAERDRRAKEEGQKKGRETAESDHKAEMARREGILEIARHHGLEDDAKVFIETRKSEAEFAAHIAKRYRDGYKPIASAPAPDKETRKLLGAFSLRKFILGAIMGEALSGAEREVQALGQQEAQARSLEVGSGYLPSEAISVIAARAAMVSRAGQNATTGTAGANLVATENLGLISALRPRLWMDRFGVRMLSGLVNNITIPSIETENDAQDRTETLALDLTDIILGQRTLSPSRVGSQCRFSLQLLRQSSPQIDGVISEIILSRIARRYNAKAIEFLLALTGTSAVVTGGAALTRTIMREFITKVKAANADDMPGKFLINADVEGKLAETKVDTGSGLFVYTEKENGDGRILNRDALTTSLVPNDLGAGDNLSAIIFGSFSELWMGDWGGVDLVRDIYTKAATGEVVTTANSFIGFAAAHPAAFAIAEDVDPAAE